MKYNIMCGSDKLFSDLEQLIIEYTENNKFSPEEFSDIVFAYSVRGNISEKMKTFFNSYIETNSRIFKTYHTMHNLFYYFMFIDYINLEVVRNLVESFEKISTRLPLTYYRPFKLFDFYLSNCEISEISVEYGYRMRQKFYYAEQLYDYVKYENVYGNTDEIKIFTDILKFRLLKEPIKCLVKDNLLIMHYSFPQYKIAINLWNDRCLVPKTNGNKRVNQMHLLNAKLLRMRKWEILDLVWDDYLNLGDQIKKDEFIHNWFENAKISQHKKGITNIKPKFV